MTDGSPAGPDDQFPRAKSLPKQSPLFWVAEKDRYLRQLLIRDIQTATGRPLVVYFASTTDSRAQIAQGDDVYFTELLRDTKDGVADLLIETSGGFTDATEKIASILRGTIKDLRVIVPCRAKSNGTMLALIGSCIVMGVGSELGPADPFITIAPNSTVPAHFLLAAQNAKQLLSTGMMQGKPSANIDQVVQALSSRVQYPSHGSVIDADEAARLGLSVTKLSPDDELWQRVWLLRCMYEHDLRRAGALKIFEGAYISNSLRAA
jgi:hypothetical protein